MKKRRIYTLFLVLVLVFLTGCKSKSNQELDYKSIKDNTENVLVKLNDKKSTIDKTLGKPKYNSDLEGYDYANGITIIYNEKNRAIVISAQNSSSNDFEILNYKTGEAIDSLNDSFHLRIDSEGLRIYDLYYDKKGNPCEQSDAAYSILLTYRDGVYESLKISIVQ